MNMLLAIAVGGAAGALGRHFVNVAMVSLIGHGFPWGTFAVNVCGSFMLGFLAHAFAVSWTVTPEIRALLTVGLLGAFTTFSTFSLDVVTLYERGQTGFALLYLGASVAVSIGALFVGLRVARLFLA